ncbi:MAG TPA: CDP-diacylglycerol--serine O-phosphatidyltransferase [Terriglobia bacterium]|nr:CDP-diacylglycerol--serine O-phosphatidyltransferase [Terriglobia bacterium]
MNEPRPTLEPKRRSRLHGGFYVLPSLFTVGTLVCGYLAILSTLKATSTMLAGGPTADLSRVAFDYAARAIGWAVLFDGFDGRIARLTNSTSDFGREFDSLADVIAFGVAPALLAFAWGIRPLEELVGPLWGEHLRSVGWIVTFAFVICGAARLARFNIQSTRPATDRRHFVGLPIPAAAGVIAAVVHWRKYAVHNWNYGMGWLVLVAFLSFLMVSRVRYPSFKNLDLRRARPYAAIILIGLVIYLVYAYSEYVLMVGAVGYMLSGPTARLLTRHRPSPPPPQEVHAQ